MTNTRHRRKHSHRNPHLPRQIGAVGLQGSTSLTVAVALGAELLAVAHCEDNNMEQGLTYDGQPQSYHKTEQTSAIDFPIRSLAAVHRVQILLAVAALEASLVVGLQKTQSTNRHVQTDTEMVNTSFADS